MKTFKRWCEDSGRRSTGCSDYAEFERNAQDYEKYREQEERRIKLEKQGETDDTEHAGAFDGSHSGHEQV